MCRPCRGWRRTSRFFPTAAPATSLRARGVGYAESSRQGRDDNDASLAGLGGWGTRSCCARRGKGAGKMPAVRGGCTGAMRRDGDFRFEIGDFRGSGTTGPKGRHPAESREEESTEKAPEGFLAALGMTRGESSRGFLVRRPSASLRASGGLGMAQVERAAALFHSRWRRWRKGPASSAAGAGRCKARRMRATMRLDIRLC